jgi:pectate lyase
MTRWFASAALALAAATALAESPATQPSTQPARQKAFPTAEGFGQFAQGGRGGAVLFVENLNDNGPGSLRAAVSAKGPRTIVFRVSGTIELAKPLVVTEPFVTIAGQTAPGDGVCLANYEFYLRAHNAIVRHLRVRPGNDKPGERDAITVKGVHDTIVDHCSGSWAIDEVLSTTGSHDVTVQWCMIAEALHDAGHHKGDHGFGGLIGSDRISYHHNLYAHNRSRNPRPASGFIDFRNNVIYNWNKEAGYAGQINKQRLNYIANYLKPGPSTAEGRYIAFHTGGPETFVHTHGNVLEGVLGEGQNDLAIINARDDVNLVEKPFDVIAPRTFTATEAFQQVLEQVGATLPKRDPVDTRIIASVRDGTGALINSHHDVGAWPALKSADRPVDADRDGMPDAWEQQHGLNPSDPDDRNNDPDGDGYTNLEEFLNGTDPGAKD